MERKMKGTKFTISILNPDYIPDPRIPVNERQDRISKTGTVLVEDSGVSIVQLDDGTKPFAIPTSALEKK
jgi:hypothetical protein